MTKRNCSRVATAALMVVMILAMALPVTAQESAPLCHCAGVEVERLNNQGLFQVVASFGGSGQARLFDQTTNTPIAGTVRSFNDTSITWEVTLVSPANVVQISTNDGQSWQTQPGCVLVLPPPLAVVLTDFAAACHQGSQILVSWETASEIGNSGFNMLRSADGGQVVYSWFIPSNSPGGTTGANYTYFDFDIVLGQTYWYWLESVDINGATVRYGTVVSSCEPPTALKLSTFSAESARVERLPGCASIGATALLGALGFVLFQSRRRRHNF